jgi:hypothetical protein
VEAVPADAVLLRELGVDRIRRRAARHARMKRGVEDGDMREIGQRLLGAPDPREVCRIVERREGHAFLDGADRVVVDEHGAEEPRAAVHHAMRDRADRVALHLGEHACDGPLVRVRRLADALDLLLEESLTGGWIDEPSLECRRACVEDENVHAAILAAIVHAL